MSAIVHPGTITSILNHLPQFTTIQRYVMLSSRLHSPVTGDLGSIGVSMILSSGNEGTVPLAFYIQCICITFALCFRRLRYQPWQTMCLFLSFQIHKRKSRQSLRLMLDALISQLRIHCLSYITTYKGALIPPGSFHKHRVSIEFIAS